MIGQIQTNAAGETLFISFVSVSSILLLVTMGIMLYVDITRS